MGSTNRPQTPRRALRAAARRRVSGLVAALLAAGALVVTAPAGPVAAAPGTPAAVPARAPNPDHDDEGGDKKLRDALQAAARGHLEAKAKLDNAVKQQATLTAELKLVEARLATLSVEVGAIAAESYRLGRLNPVTMLLNSASPEAFLDRAAGLDMLAQLDGRKVRELVELREGVTRAKQAIDAAVNEQKRQLAVLARKKRDAERALAAVSNGASGGFTGGGSSSARPAPRNPDGSWPSESCSVNDPTTSGCITPRMLHAYNEARSAGYRRYTKCFREQNSGEHPKGRACDFSSAETTFKDSAATGDDRTYGNNLAAWCVRNASRLGVLYVIWYRQIWLPNTGWRSYSGSGGAAAEHTNHVHLSVY